LERYPNVQEEVAEAQGAYLDAYDVWVEADKDYKDALNRYSGNPTPENLKELRDVEDVRTDMLEVLEIYKYRADQKYKELVQLKQKIESIQRLIDEGYPSGGGYSSEISFPDEQGYSSEETEAPEGAESPVGPVIFGAGALALLLALV